MFFLSADNFLPKIQNSGLKIPYFGEFKGKIKILSTHNLICWKIATSCPTLYFLTHDAAGDSYWITNGLGNKSFVNRSVYKLY